MDGESSESDWRQKCRSLGEQLWYMYQSGIAPDLEIHLFDHNLKKMFYRCHKVVFLRLSPVFQTLIGGVDKEEGKLCCITLVSLNPAPFEIILRYAYSDQLELTSMTDALEIKEFCINYKILRLLALCEDYISIHFELSKDNIWDCMRNHASCSKKLKTKFKEILGKSTLECIQSPMFPSCSQSSLQRLLSMETLAIESELQLVQAAMHWARVQNGGVDLDPQSSKKLLGPCLKQLRFLTLTPAEFSVHVANSGLFSSDDTLKILINLTSPGAMEMPAGLSTSTTHRNSTAKPAAQLEPLNEAAQFKPPTSVRERSSIFCHRGPLHPSLANFSKEMKSPIKFDVVEFKVNKKVFLSGIRISAQVKKIESSDDETYRETVHVSVRQKSDKLTLIAYHSLCKPVNYDSGYVDVVFSTPGALLAEEMYVLEVNFKSEGVYLCKLRSDVVQFQKHKITFSLNNEKFPFSGILHSLFLSRSGI